MEALKRIEAHTDQELNEAIEIAISKFGHKEFFTLLHGIDAYMERRKRRDARRHTADMNAALAETLEHESWGDNWGDGGPAYERKLDEANQYRR